MTQMASRPEAGGSAAPTTEPARQWFETDPLWFKRAVFYEIHIRGFADGNDDGSGDFRGLADKLDYLQWLGITCIWLLPMYPSPLRDGGYDIADFFSIHPDYGTVEDFRTFVDAAHGRGIRVIADLVMNHTSSDHPWFQEARSDPSSPKRDWYVWSQQPQGNNWYPLNGAYYYAAFGPQMPDLNLSGPAFSSGGVSYAAAAVQVKSRRRCGKEEEPSCPPARTKPLSAACSRRSGTRATPMLWPTCSTRSIRPTRT